MTKETSWLVPTLILPRDKVIVKQGATVSCYLGDKCLRLVCIQNDPPLLYSLPSPTHTTICHTRKRETIALFLTGVANNRRIHTKKPPTITTLTALSKGVRSHIKGTRSTIFSQGNRFSQLSNSELVHVL